MARKRPKKTFEETNHEILTALDIKAEYQQLGVEVTGSRPNAGGWIECHAAGREDNKPSAAINTQTGRYKDSGGEGLSLSLWDFAVQFGSYPDWMTARKEFAAKAGVRIGSAKPPADPAENISWQRWNPILAGIFCHAKGGIDPEAIQAAGGRLGIYRREYSVVALPVFGAAGINADPVGWAMFERHGGKLPVFHRDAKPSWKKCKLTAGSRPGLLGFRCLDAAESSPDNRRTIWKVEGISDLLALESIIPPELADSHFAVTNANGATEAPKDSMAAPFRGATVYVLHDADRPGQAGAERWAEWLQLHAAAVRIVRLPFEIAENHGKDLRDWILAGGSYAELLDLAEDCKAASGGVRGSSGGSPDSSGTSSSAGSDSGESRAETEKPASEKKSSLQVIEADDDPHRLAKIYLDQHATHKILGDRLKFWRSEWHEWNGRKYCRVEELDMRAKLIRTIKQEFDRLNLIDQETATDGDELPRARKVSGSLVGNVLAAMASLVSLEAQIEAGTWLDAPTAKTSHVALQNGVLDVEGLLSGDENCLRSHSPDWFSPVCLPYNFDPEAEAHEWKSIIAQNLEGDLERIQLLQEWAGYLLLPDTGQQRFMFLEGEGSNGKSVYCAGIIAMLGVENVAHVPLEQFGQRFSLTQTLGKLANVAAEVGELDKAAEGFLKSFTSGDRMMFDRKGLPAIEAKPTARLLLAANNRPRFSDRSGGLWRRMLLVPFLREVPDHEKKYGLDTTDYWCRSGELPGLLNWAIAGLYQLRKQGKFTTPKICGEALEDYRLESNPARQFLQEKCELDPEDHIQTQELYRIYASWCRRFGYHPLGERQFGKEVKRQFPDAEKRRVGPRGDRTYIYQGITFSDNAENLESSKAF